MDSSETRPSIDPLAYPALASKARVQIDRVTGDPVLLYPEGVLMLNPTGSAIVALCDGKQTVQGVIASLATRYGAPPDAIAPDVLEYLERLQTRCLIDLNREPGE